MKEGVDEGASHPGREPARPSPVDPRPHPWHPRPIMEGAPNRAAARSPKARTMATITSLEALVGAHPDALADFFASGAPCDPSTLGTRRGRLLAVAALGPMHAASRPLLVALATRLTPWTGKAFESGGTSGSNVVFGHRRARFHAQIAPSNLDGEPSLVMRYDGLKNPWPLPELVEELREVGPGVALGPLLWRGSHVLLWWGLELGATP